MAKKILLHTRSEPAFFTLIGISCQLMDYRLIHALNKDLGSSFSKEEDFRTEETPKRPAASFSLYHYRDDDNRNTYYLISNKSQEIMLLPELKHTDFFMLIEGVFRNPAKENLLRTIRSIPRVMAAFEVNIRDVKSPETFLTDLEMHFTNIRKETRQKLKTNR
jgi:hypothetical protein